MENVWEKWCAVELLESENACECLLIRIHYIQLEIMKCILTLQYLPALHPCLPTYQRSELSTFELLISPFAVDCVFFSDYSFSRQFDFL